MSNGSNSSLIQCLMSDDIERVLSCLSYAALLYVLSLLTLTVSTLPIFLGCLISVLFYVMWIYYVVLVIIRADSLNRDLKYGVIATTAMSVFVASNLYWEIILLYLTSPGQSSLLVMERAVSKLTGLSTLLILAPALLLILHPLLCLWRFFKNHLCVIVRQIISRSMVARDVPDSTSSSEV